jgi:hypothetical protein
LPCELLTLATNLAGAWARLRHMGRKKHARNQCGTSCRIVTYPIPARRTRI